MTRPTVVLSFLASLSLAVPGYADDEVSEIDFCRDLSLIAKEVMSARQRDRPMSETLPAVTDRIKKWGDKYELEIDMESAEETAAEMVMTAYEQSISTDSFKKERITEFENSFFKECYEVVTSDSDSDADDISLSQKSDLPLQGTSRNALPESTSGMWAVQLGSFSEKENAETLAADLRRQGYAAFLSELKLDADSSLYRVRIGPQKDMASSESMAARLLDAGHKGEIVPHP